MVDSFFFDVSETFPYQTTKVVVPIVTLFIELFTLIHASIVLYVVYKNSIIHRNLKIVSYNLWVCIIVKCCANIFVNLRRIFFPDFMLPSGLGEMLFITRQVSNSGMIDLPCMIVVERMYSIINAKTYEEWFSWTFIIILCGCTWSSPVLIMLNMFYFPSVFPLIYTYLIFDVVLIALYALYFFAYFFTGNKSLIGLPLSERYQRTENKTAYHTMLKFAITMAFIVAFSSSYVVLSLIVPYYFNNVNMHDKEAFIRYINDILVDCCILILPYHFVHVHPSLVKRYRNVLHMTLFRCFRGSVNTECPHVIQVKSTAGHNLTLPDESNYYFKALADQWDVNIYSNSRRLFFPEFLLPKLVGDIVHAVREVTNSGMIVVPSMIVIERLHSVIYAKTYEKYFSWVFIILVCGSIWLFVIWIMIDLFYLDKYLPIIYTYTFSNLFLITVYTIYFLTYFITTNKSIIGLSLSERYQRAENKATYRTMLKFAITLFIPYQFVNASEDDQKAFLRYIIDMIVACFIFVLPYHFVHVHPSLMKRYNSFFYAASRKCPRVASSDSADMVQIKSITGRNLKLPHETDYYFKSLTDQWDAQLIQTERK